MRDYSIPDYEYDKILFIEKKGLWPTIEASGLPKKYDMAVIAGEGYSCEAARVLLARAAKNCTIFVLHDADPDGYNIARTLSEETKRMPDHNIEVINLGLTVAQAVEMGLEPETFNRKNKLTDSIEFTPLELSYFEGEPQNKHHMAKRVELNAMSAGQLIELIEAGILANVETKKLIPPKLKSGDVCILGSNHYADYRNPAILIMTPPYPIPDCGGGTIRFFGVRDQPSNIKSSKCSQFSKQK